MKWASAVDTSPALPDAIERCAAHVLEGLGGIEPDLVIAFVSAEHSPQYERVPELLTRQFDSATIFGCGATAVIGGGQEVEERPAVSLTAAVLPGVGLSAVHLQAAQLPPTYADKTLWEQALRVEVQRDPAFLLLADPYSFDTEALLKGMDRAFPFAVKAGGLASAADTPGMNALFLRDTTHRTGAIALALTGNIDVRSVVTQGSRPVGDPMFVTAVHENLIRELDGREARDVLEMLFERLSADDRDLVSDALSIGIALATQQTSYGAGDFLVSDILGVDPESGALWVNTQVPLNHVVQFHLRDTSTAGQDLERVLTELRNSSGPAPVGAMLFTCTGRGVHFYGQPDHDTNAFRRIVADVPVGGCFCSGEIGPLQQTNYVHGYTSSFAVFSPRSSKKL
jgi:small ligand-binding sensory domain FIST